MTARQPLHVLEGSISLPNAKDQNVIIQVLGGEMRVQETGVHGSYRYGDNGSPRLQPMGYSYVGTVFGNYHNGETGDVDSIVYENCIANGWIKLGIGEKWSGPMNVSVANISGSHDEDDMEGKANCHITIRFQGKPTIEGVGVTQS